MSRPSSAEQVAQRAFDLGLLDEQQLQEIWGSLGTHNVPVETFLQVLVRREFLTNYQVDRLLKGERGGFFFGDYKVLYLVGTGSFARVYRAVHRTTSQVVALKVLRKTYSDTPAQFSQFVREGEVGCTLRHPNIVPIFEVFSHRTTHFLVMEFVEGRNLREFLKIRQRLEVPEATRLMIDIAAGMQYAFEHGLTHRDLKPSNILVSSRGQAKLVDFGLAAVDESLGDNFTDATNPRTIDYAALERATGVRRDDTRSDIYFMGCIYYHMLAGKAPLAETDRVMRLSKTRFQEVVPIRNVEASMPQVVAHVVSKAMELDPLRRYQTPGQMLSDLHVAARRIAHGDDGSDVRDSSQSLGSALRLEDQQSIMVVEANAQMQDALREGLKRAGYRVLLTSDPARALERFQDNPNTAGGILLDAQDLGEAAVTAFNQLAEHPKTAEVPALLLLDETQMERAGHLHVSQNRVAILLPITMKKLRMALARLLPPKKQAEPTGQGSTN